MDDGPLPRGVPRGVPRWGRSAQRPVRWFILVLLITGGLALGDLLAGTRAMMVVGVILLAACSWTLRRWVFRRR